MHADAESGIAQGGTGMVPDGTTPLPGGLAARM